MFRNRLYYRIKPLLPRLVRLSVRRQFALRKRERVKDVWPVLPGAGAAPKGWTGWPGGKQFAVVLTHDVEGPEGLAKCRDLMEVERKLGFRSSFNFIPEGPYRVSPALRQDLTSEGFEVGVHDLRHDGKLYADYDDFARYATRINHYLREWRADGFRAGFMMRNLNWIHELNVEYDASTFDTDPFEPQPDGVGTIFPFWVPSPENENGNGRRRPLGQRDGYVELPYTLPQDSTLFLLFGEQTPQIWFDKVDWVARHGGMVLVDTHPDYMAMNGARPGRWEYPVALYEQLLTYIKLKYPGAFWAALPREVAKEVQGRRQNAPLPLSLVSQEARPKIWIDLDNTPHVPFFEPIIDELRDRGFPLLVTARDAFQVCDLADEKRLPYIKVGRHYGKSPLLKAGGLGYRALQLAPLILSERPALGVSHGARSQLLLGNLLHIPTLLLEDYEHARFPFSMRPTWVMAPTVIPDAALCGKNGQIRKYRGIKEDVYAWKLKPDTGLLQYLGIRSSDIVVTVRPPATEAHYHNPESEQLFSAFMLRAFETPGVKVVLLPRNKKQGELIQAKWPASFDEGKTVIPDKALDGLNLIWHSDLVVSGGGTMNREAAALGVPVYSIFRGTIGAVDHHLQSEGRLVLIESVKDVHEKIAIVRRTRKPLGEVTSKITLNEIVAAIEEIAGQKRS